ncbi:hypothetical protein P4O66_006099 [Electrophorus voltai]|uniref:TNFR-Cys domain-containing protein n=1 Tax=Electrophorus voltai TaxID=2609070 RepID=A0AAD8ZLP2_9TELE|nr:hypothetical protein P4O66_006099 [Electrophorus voltai]
MWTALVALLLFPQSLGFRVESGCMKWRHVSNPVSGVCCEVCHSGSCRPCPAGTFNNQPHSRCVKWMESCPEPDQRVTTPGTAFSDIVCSTEPDRRPTTPQADLSPRHSHDSVGFVLAVSVVCTCLIICVALPLLVTSVWRRGEPMKKPQDTQEVLAGQRSVSDLEHCSFCFPQEECGSISAASLISHGDDKPFELVV